MKLDFKQNAFEDFQYWIKSDRKKALKIAELLYSIESDPFSGIGQPEPLKYELSGFWSRRIDNEHRLVYRIRDDCIEILSYRYHYI